jgi:hypothetical protein
MARRVDCQQKFFTMQFIPLSELNLISLASLQELEQLNYQTSASSYLMDS